MKKAIDAVHRAARDCESPLLDEPVWVQSKNNFGYFEGQHIGEVFMDVPLSAVSCLGHGNFFYAHTKTWREAALCLHGSTWDDEIFRYFEGPMQENKFPVSDSMYELKLKAIGGLVVCTNGNHRLVAAKSWLLHKGTTDLKQVKVNRYRIDPVMGGLAKRALTEKEQLSICPLSFEERLYLRLDDGQEIDSLIRMGKGVFYAKNESGLHQLKPSLSLKDMTLNLRGKPLEIGFSAWSDVPFLALEKMLDINWR